MKKLCESLREHAKCITDFEKKKMIPLTNEELKWRCKIILHLWKIMLYFIKKLAEDINHQQVRDHCHYTGKYRGAAHSICNLKFNVPKKIPVVFHRGSNYDYHFVKRKWQTILRLVWMPWGKQGKV